MFHHCPLADWPFDKIFIRRQKNWLTAAGENIGIARLLDKVGIGVAAHPRIKLFQTIKGKLFLFITDHSTVYSGDIFWENGPIRENKIHLSVPAHKYRQPFLKYIIQQFPGLFKP